MLVDQEEVLDLQPVELGQVAEVAQVFLTRVARGQSIDDSLKWGVGEYRRIFAKHKKA